MENNTTIARPYARAAYEYAKCHGQISNWLDMIYNCKLFVQHPYVNQLISSPVYPQREIADFLVLSLKKHLDEYILNFIFLLAENNRLNIFPCVYELFSFYKSEDAKLGIVVVSTARKISDNSIKGLKLSLEKKYNYKFHVKVKIEPQLIGGVVIQFGDSIIDGSVRSNLQKMKKILQA